MSKALSTFSRHLGSITEGITEDYIVDPMAQNGEILTELGDFGYLRLVGCETAPHNKYLQQNLKEQFGIAQVASDVHFQVIQASIDSPSSMLSQLKTVSFTPIDCLDGHEHTMDKERLSSENTRLILVAPETRVRINKIFVRKIEILMESFPKLLVISNYTNLDTLLTINNHNFETQKTIGQWIVLFNHPEYDEGPCAWY
jgi:hypothetical protein